MAFISLRQLLDHAAEHSYGVPAFNVNNLEQMRAIMEAAAETDSPVIVQASRGADRAVMVLDPRGDTVMDASGQLTFKNDETDWTVDWEPTGIRTAGEFQVLVRIGGNPLGTFPIKVEAKPTN